MQARDLMNTPVLTCHVNDPLHAAAQKMWDGDIGALPVVNDDGKLVGMITDRDICMAALTQGRALYELLVNSAMSKHAVSCVADATVGEIEQLMAMHRIRRVPVVDGVGAPIGIVSVNDIAIESVQPDTAIRHAPSKLAHMLAAICRHRAPDQHAA